MKDKRGIIPATRETTLIRKVWLAARSRCTNKFDSEYKNYGARGIYMVPEWDSFLQFYTDMGPRPNGYRLERVDNDGPYCKANCIWATATAQVHNQRVRADNTSGLKGVTWDNSPKKQRWFVRGVTKGVYTFLYQGPDFFEACCARKSWENRVGLIK